MEGHGGMYFGKCVSPWKAMAAGSLVNVFHHKKTIAACSLVIVFTVATTGFPFPLVWQGVFYFPIVKSK